MAPLKLTTVGTGAAVDRSKRLWRHAPEVVLVMAAFKVMMSFLVG